MRHRVAVMTGAVLAGTVVNAVCQTPAVADQPGFSVTVDAPGEFTAGGAGKAVTAVITSRNRQCRKVRWVLLVRTDTDPGRMKVDRIEDRPDFDIDISTEGDRTTIVDEALDPGVLCRGRTVTGRWEIEFDGRDGGAVQFEVQAFDVRDELLTAGGAAARVEGEKAPPPSEEATGEAPEEAEPVNPPADRESDDPQPGALVAEESTLLGPGLIVGGVFVFLGVLLLLRIRSRAKQAQRRAEALPTGFYTMPGAPR